jgi:hypothetical protein
MEQPDSLEVTMYRSMNRENITQSICFVAVLALFCILSIGVCIFSRESVSEQENRALADFPKIHTLRKDIPKFPAAFEPFFKDHLPFRLALIYARNLGAFEIFHTSGNPLVVVGQQNWLFYKSYGVTPAQLNLEPFTEEELHDWAQNIVARNSFLKEHHIKYLLVIAPEKGSMYPELLPSGWHRSNMITRLEQLQNYLRQHSTVDFVDARRLLAEEKAASQKIYHSNDSHWNQRSAFLVSQEMLSHLHKNFESITPVPSRILLQGHDKFNGDLSKMLGLQSILPDYSPSIVVNKAPLAVPVNKTVKLANMGSQENCFATRTNDETLPRALVLRDSFSTYLVAPLSEHFRFCEYQWTNEFHPIELLTEKPNVVINEIAERHLYEEFHEHIPEITTVSANVKPICSFGNKIELIGLSANRNFKGTILKLRWRGKEPVSLDYVVGVQCLNRYKKPVGNADYQPDFLQRNLAKGTEWVDTVAIQNRELKNATELALSIYHPGKDTLKCNPPDSDLKERFVTSFQALNH